MALHTETTCLYVDIYRPQFDKPHNWRVLCGNSRYAKSMFPCAKNRTNCSTLKKTKTAKLNFVSLLISL